LLFVAQRDVFAMINHTLRMWTLNMKWHYTGPSRCVALSVIQVYFISIIKLKTKGYRLIIIERLWSL